MKKHLYILVSFFISLSLIGCSNNEIVSNNNPASNNKSKVKVLTFEEFKDAEIDDEITIDTYIQAKQTWWDNSTTLYTQDEQGAYFIYNLTCSKQQYKKFVPGQKIRITGYKSVWNGEVEIIDATFELLDGNYIAQPVDITSYLGTDEIKEYQNSFVSFSDLIISSPAKYKWDGSGSEGDDLYFDVSYNGKNYTFTVESFLCDSASDVYKDVLSLKKGDKVDLEGFLYWYNGINPHITSVTKK